MGKLSSEKKIVNQSHKSKLPDSSQNLGKKGRPRKRQDAQPQQNYEQQQWFHSQRCLSLLTLICDKGSLALRYKTGQRSNQIDDETKYKKNEETRKLKNKLRELKQECNYDEKVPYLLIQENKDPNCFTIDDSLKDEHKELLEDIHKIFSFLHPEFIETIKLVCETLINNENLEHKELVQIIVNSIYAEPMKHQMILNLAYIKINIEKDLDYVLKLANAQDINYEYVVEEKPIKNNELQRQWAQEFIDELVKIMIIQTH